MCVCCEWFDSVNYFLLTLYSTHTHTHTLHPSYPPKFSPFNPHVHTHTFSHPRRRLIVWWFSRFLLFISFAKKTKKADWWSRCMNVCAWLLICSLRSSLTLFCVGWWWWQSSWSTSPGLCGGHPHVRRWWWWWVVFFFAVPNAYCCRKILLQILLFSLCWCYFCGAVKFPPNRFQAFFPNLSEEENNPPQKRFKKMCYRESFWCPDDCCRIK